jgi:hypothetical protein
MALSSWVPAEGDPVIRSPFMWVDGRSPGPPGWVPARSHRHLIRDPQILGVLDYQEGIFGGDDRLIPLVRGDLISPANNPVHPPQT